MAEQADALEREDELDSQDQDQGDAGGEDQGQHQGEGDQAGDQDHGQDEGGDANDADEFEIHFGDEAAPASKGENSDLVRHLRAEVRKRDDELAAIKSGRVQPTPAVVDPGAKPTLEDCEYDGDKFEAELLAWNERKRKADEAVAQTQQKANAEQERFAQRLQVFESGKTALKAKDYEVAEAAVVAGLSQVQQAIVIKAAGDPAKLVYALGRHGQKLATLAAIEDPIEFTAALVKLEGTLKVTQRGRTPPEPDRAPRGAAPYQAKTDPALERLEREAARTGDRTKVVQYRRQQRLKA